MLLFCVWLWDLLGRPVSGVFGKTRWRLWGRNVVSKRMEINQTDDELALRRVETSFMLSGQMVIFHLHLDFCEIAKVPFPFQNATFWGNDEP